MSGKATLLISLFFSHCSQNIKVREKLRKMLLIQNYKGHKNIFPFSEYLASISPDIKFSLFR